jgi:hypothetical protein
MAVMPEDWIEMPSDDFPRQVGRHFGEVYRRLDGVDQRLDGMEKRLDKRITGSSCGWSRSSSTSRT